MSLPSKVWFLHLSSSSIGSQSVYLSHQLLLGSLEMRKMPRGPAKQTPRWIEGEAWQETDGRKRTKGDVREMRRLGRPRGSPRGFLSLDTAVFPRFFLLDCFFFRALLYGLSTYHGARRGQDRRDKNAGEETTRPDSRTQDTTERLWSAAPASMHCC